MYNVFQGCMCPYVYFSFNMLPYWLARSREEVVLRLMGKVKVWLFILWASNSCWDTSVRTQHVSLMEVQEENGGHQSLDLSVQRLVEPSGRCWDVSDKWQLCRPEALEEKPEDQRNNMMYLTGNHKCQSHRSTWRIVRGSCLSSSSVGDISVSTEMEDKPSSSLALWHEHCIKLDPFDKRDLLSWAACLNHPGDAEA